MIKFKQILEEVNFKSLGLKPQDFYKYMKDNTDDINQYIEGFSTLDQFEDKDDNEIESSVSFKKLVYKDIIQRYNDSVERIQLYIKGNKIQIYRGMTVPKNFISKLKDGQKIGKYWTYNLKCADPTSYWGYNKGITIIIGCIVNVTDVDWKKTMLLNVALSLGELEQEICIKENTKVKINKFFDVEENEIEIPNKIKQMMFLIADKDIKS